MRELRSFSVPAFLNRRLPISRHAMIRLNSSTLELSYSSTLVQDASYRAEVSHGEEIDQGSDKGTVSLHISFFYLFYNYQHQFSHAHATTSMHAEVYQ